MPAVARYQRRMLAQKDAMDLRDMADRILIALERDDELPGLEREGQKAAAVAADLGRQLTALTDIDEIAARVNKPEEYSRQPGYKGTFPDL